ncbi:response regulator transcription factor [Streptomyces sp. NPDC056149]|uniref:response regulator transcription factor n=1 Tax=unclassified Streptomyces TaxID=2593676 RepID=UPI002381005E|nr:response regulator transcription factor [Streptomyces sp. WZ-12]
MRILFAQSDRVVARATGMGLRRLAINVDVANCGDEAERLSNFTDYDVIVLDHELGPIGGYELCRRLAERKERPRILLLTADQVAAKVRGLQLGADDCLTRPFAFPELVARVRALGRHRRTGAPLVLRHEGITLDPARREVRVHGKPVGLTPKEFAVLQLLMEAKGLPVRHEELLAKVWDANMDSRTNAVRATISRLRRKLGDRDAICTDNGKGYCLA